MTSLREMVARIDERTIHTADGVDEIKATLKSQGDRIDVLERDKIKTRAWAAGFGAAAVFALDFLKEKAHLLFTAALACFLVSCAPMGPYGADGWWHDNRRPVRVMVDGSMSIECVSNTIDAVFFWRGLGATYLRPEVVGHDWEGFHHEHPRGTIAVKLAAMVDIQLGVTHRQKFNHRMLWAVVRLNDMRPDKACSPVVIRHELGHALGLEHHPDDAHLMYGRASGQLLDEDEISWVQ